MANKTIAENIRQAIEDFDKIKEAIINKGVNIENIPTSQYSLKIDEIETGNVKQFSTVDEMNSSTDNKEGNLALIYSKQIGNATSEAEFNMFNCPETVTLPNTISEDTWLYSSFRATDESAWVDLSVEISNTSARIDVYGDDCNLSIEYTSEDGVNYTRTTEVTNPISLPTAVKCSYVEDWNDAIGYFVLVETVNFQGIYEYKDGQYNLASTQLNVNADKVYEASFYGKNGVEQGTLQNTEGLTTEQLKFRIELWQKYQNLSVGDTNLSNAFAGYEGETIPKINTSNVTNMNAMFSRSSIKELPLLDTSNVTDMSSMLYQCSNLEEAPLLNTSKVTNMSYMFSWCTSLKTIPLLDTSNVTDMSHFLQDSTAIETIPLLNTSKVTNMYEFVEGCTALTEFPLLDTSNVTSMYQMFKGCTALKTVPNINTENVTNMFALFSGCTSLETVPVLNTSNVTKARNIFYGCTSLVTMPQFDLSKATEVSFICSGCTSLVNVPVLDISSVTAGVYTQDMFKGCTALSNESLNNILVMCANSNITSNTSYKTLKKLGLSSAQATTCKTLSNYQAFINAGWTTGY